MKLIQFIFLSYIFFCSLSIQAKNLEQNKILNIHNSWIKQAINLTKNTPGYSAPVAARTFAYLSIGIYESSVEVISNQASLSNQLNGYKRTVWCSNNKNIDFVLLSNYVDFKLINYFFENMPPSSQKVVDDLYKKNKIKGKQIFSRKTIKKTEEYGDKLIEELLSWVKKDGAIYAWNNNFNTKYTPPFCEGCWVKTYPGYVQSLQPYWGENRLIIKSNKEICKNIPVLKYSSDTNSEFHQEAIKINKLYLNLSDKNKNTAKYWDDGMGISGTPVGHLFNIALNVSISQKLNLTQTLEMYSLLGISINDAVIESWRLKYLHNLIRPISYIKKNINHEFNTAITTPPFPEFPSGHSFQAGSASQIFNFCFSDSLSFIDNSHQNRTDIKGEPRTYISFDIMAQEMSISRYYGGIHYLKTLEISLEKSKEIGRNTIRNIKFKKE